MIIVVLGLMRFISMLVLHAVFVFRLICVLLVVGFDMGG